LPAVVRGVAADLVGGARQRDAGGGQTGHLMGHGAFSICQWLRMKAASSAGLLWWGRRSVIA
jgi:hypothetical protein